MQKIVVFTLQKHQGEYQTWPLKTQLFHQGIATETYISGFELLYQFYLPTDEYLLITDWDCPFEEATEFILLDNNFKIRAHRTLAVPYGSFLLMDLEILDADNIKLKFDEDDFWLLTVLPKRKIVSARWGLAFWPLLRSRLKLSRMKSG